MSEEEEMTENLQEYLETLIEQASDHYENALAQIKNETEEK